MENNSGYNAIRQELARRLEEPPPGRVQILTGPRQVGKTTMLLVETEKWGEAAIYLAADAPEASLAGWWEAQWRQATERAHRGVAVLMIDEVQYLREWPRLIKSAIDQVYREQLPLHIVISGSASLEMARGTRETMAGRFEKLVLRQWTARDLASEFGLSRDEAVETVVRFGSFPGGMRLLADPARWESYIRESIVEPAIGRDLLMLEAVRKPALLRQIYAVCAGHPGEILSLKKIAGAVTDPGTSETVAHYLHLLNEAFLVAPLPKYSKREVRKRAAPPKIVLLSNALLAAAGGARGAESPEVWGRWVENACLAYAINSGQNVSYWRDEPHEVDAVIDGSWGKWAVEVKTGAFSGRDLAGLLEFVRRSPEFAPLVVCEEQYADAPRRLGIRAIDWREFLWSGVEP